MRIAFYAPLKHPDHRVPSGDRRLAQLFMQAMRMGGHEVTLASRFRSFDAHGDAARQARLARLGRRLAERLTQRYRAQPDPPHVWFTYHLYHKAPDVLGPQVSRALGIPYIVAEASVAPKQRCGAWSLGYAEALRAVLAADAVVAVNPVDVAEVVRVRGADAISEMLRPFVDVGVFAGTTGPSQEVPGKAVVRLVTVAMMRDGAKLASYRLLADALARIEPSPWDLTVVGDGSARESVEAAFAQFGPDRVHFLGRRNSADVAAILRGSDLFVWPAIDEAFGMVFLEAQACGVPVVAGDTAGVRAVVEHCRGGLLVPLGDAAAFAAATLRLVGEPGLRGHMGNDALEYVRAHHDLPSAAAQLDALLVRVHTLHRRSRSSAQDLAQPC